MPGKALAIGELGVLLLDPGAVEQDQPRHLVAGGGGVDAAAEAVDHQPRQVAAMVQVRMGEHHRVDVARFGGQSFPVQFAQVLQALEQAAVHQDAGVAVAEQMLGTGDGAGTAQAGESRHVRASSFGWEPGHLADPDVSP